MMISTKIFNTPAQLKISVELRVGAGYPSDCLEEAVRKTRVQEAVLYAVSGMFEEEDDKEFVSAEDWQMAPCGREERLRLHAATAPTPDERRIIRIWPQSHSATCNPANCRPMREPK
ncbi:hypothetical protein MMC30_004229 [Trapelia coarctata]|nr:hypothetical protein [Trapelia coarctata]